MLPYLTLLVELVKGIAWPLALLAIVFIFRSPLKDLLPRVRRAGPTGIELEGQSQLKVATWSGELKEVPWGPRTPLIEKVERSIHVDAQNYQEEKRYDMVVNRLAVARLSAIFERIYGAIYGSQIAALRALGGAGGKTSIAGAMEFFNNAKSKKSEMSALTFEPWLEFLKSFELVRVEGDSILIEDLGRDFLIYLTATKLSEAKVL